MHFQLCNKADNVKEHAKGQDEKNWTNYLLYTGSFFKNLIFMHCNCLNKSFNPVQENLEC